MSYNVTNWKVKELVDFKIPLLAIEVANELRVYWEANNVVEVRGWIEALEIIGNPDLDEPVINVSKIDYGGEGSGHRWEYFKKLLSYSKGKLRAVVVWEGGDSFSRLTVTDGVVSEEEIELG